jgi:hypothetical protein
MKDYSIYLGAIEGVLATGNVSEKTLREQVIRRIGSANFRDAAFDHVLGNLRNKGRVVATGATSPRLKLATIGFHTDTAASIVNHVANARGKRIRTDELKQFVAEQMPGAAPRVVWGSILGTLRRKDAVLAQDGNYIRFVGNTAQL